MVFSSLCEKLFSLHCMCIKQRLSSFCIPVLTVEDLRWKFAPEGGETAWDRGPKIEFDRCKMIACSRPGLATCLVLHQSPLTP